MACPGARGVSGVPEYLIIEDMIVLNINSLPLLHLKTTCNAPEECTNITHGKSLVSQ